MPTARPVEIAPLRSPSSATIVVRAADSLPHDGMALVVLSTEIEEILRLCHRVLVFRDQRVVARLAGADLSHDRVIAAMFGRVA